MDVDDTKSFLMNSISFGVVENQVEVDHVHGAYSEELSAIPVVALEPSGWGLIAARVDTSVTKWVTTERVSMLIRAPQNRAGVL